MSQKEISALTMLVCGLDFLSREAQTEGFSQLSQNIRKVIESAEKDYSNAGAVTEYIAGGELLHLLDLYYEMREVGIRNIKYISGQWQAGADNEEPLTTSSLSHKTISNKRH